MVLRSVLAMTLSAAGLCLAPGPGSASDPTSEEVAKADRLRLSVQELRHAIGEWEVITEFYGKDGTVARTVNGTYEFEWVTPDRVVAGKSVLPSDDRASGILFYIDEKEDKIEMVSVGPDGRLWIMTGPLGGRTRYTREYETANGGMRQLRFTSYNVQPDSFESKMEYTSDGGKTWMQGNRQMFRRATQ
jgi:hypothetical protein